MSREWWQGEKLRSSVWKTFVFALVVLGSVFYILPILWTISGSFRPLNALFTSKMQFLPIPFTWDNYFGLIKQIPIFRFIANSLIVCSLAVPGYLLSCSLCAYGFARLQFPGRDILFLVVLMLMMVPWVVLFVPQYILYSKLGWVNTYMPMIVPAFLAVGGGPFYIFLLRQFFLSLPPALEDAARIDGCSTFRIYLCIALPLAKPALGLVAIFSFIASWNDFITPLLYLRTLTKFTLPLGLSLTQSMYYFLWNYLLSMTVMSMVPPIIIFIVFQKYFVQGIKITGVKG